MKNRREDKITVSKASEIMGKSQQFIRVGIRQGLLPFGTAVKMSSIWTYYISPKLFWKYVGDQDTTDNNISEGTK